MGRLQIHVPSATPTAALLAALALALALALAVAGCGGSTASSTTQSSSSPVPAATTSAATPTPPATPPASPPTSSPPPEKEKGPTKPPPSASILVSLVGLGGEHLIPTANTCDGADTSPAIQWSAVPPHTAELAVFVLNLKPVNSGLFVDWAVAGLPPTTRGIPAGKLPAGAVVGHNGYGTDGYSICPPKGEKETYIVRLVALPHPLPAKPGFNAQAYYKSVESISKDVGLTGGTYTRP